MHKVTLCEGSEEVHHGESSEETFREFQFGLIDQAPVLRPQRSTFDKHFNGSLSTTD